MMMIINKNYAMRSMNLVIVLMATLVTCSLAEQECGVAQRRRVVLIGEIEKRGEYPWRVGIYSNMYEEDFAQICGGTILTEKIIISAAHCYWNSPVEVLFDATFYSVAAGKFFRDYNNEENKKYNYVQFSDVKAIKVPETYGGSELNQQSDIALLILQKSFAFSTSVLPICIDLTNSLFDRAQLASGNIGKGTGWGVISEGGEPSAVLKDLTLPVVNYADCRKNVPTTFRRYLTSDKFCAGYLNGTTMCSGDGGEGLVFKSSEGSVDRWYLRGLVSVGVPSETGGTCRNNTYTGFTSIFMHREWITDILNTYK